METLRHRKGCCVFAHLRDRPSQPVGQHGAGVALVMLMLHTRQVCWRRWILAREQRSRFGKGPLEVGVPEVFAGRAQACVSGFLGTLDQATRRDPILSPWEAVKVMEVIEQHEAESLPNSGHGLQ